MLQVGVEDLRGELVHDWSSNRWSLTVLHTNRIDLFSLDGSETIANLGGVLKKYDITYFLELIFCQ